MVNHRVGSYGENSREFNKENTGILKEGSLLKYLDQIRIYGRSYARRDTGRGLVRTGHSIARESFANC